MDLKNLKKTYSNGEIKVIWKPGKCIHSAICAKGLASVFKPGDKPWIQLDGSDSQSIMRQIDACPSGALSYEVLNGNT